MARIRYIKPDFFEDTDIGDLSINARYLYIASWCYMDRNGLMEYSPKLIKKNVFPYDEKITLKVIETLIQELISNEFLMMITHEGKTLLYCSTFNKHQKFHREEIPKYKISQEELSRRTACTLLAPCQHPASTLPAALVTGNWQQELATEANTSPKYPDKIDTVIKDVEIKKVTASDLYRNYEIGFVSRYKVKPSTSDELFSKLGLLAKKINKTDCDPNGLVDFYFSINDQFLIETKHPVGYLLKYYDRILSDFREFELNNHKEHLPELFALWEETLSDNGIEREITNSEKDDITKAIKIHGTKNVAKAIAGFSYEKKSDIYNPSDYITTSRLLDSGKFQRLLNFYYKKENK